MPRHHNIVLLKQSVNKLTGLWRLTEKSKTKRNCTNFDIYQCEEVIFKWFNCNCGRRSLRKNSRKSTTKKWVLKLLFKQMMSVMVSVCFTTWVDFMSLLHESHNNGESISDVKIAQKLINMWPWPRKGDEFRSHKYLLKRLYWGILIYEKHFH